MDGQRFDRLTRALASGASRRSVLKGLLGLSGAAATGAVVDEADARRGSISTPTTPPPEPTTTPAPPTCDGFPCGLDCCASADLCCDGECCPSGTQCVQEEICCRSDLVCDTATTACCAEGETCCTRDGVDHCIPTGGCCLTEECPQPDNQCLDPTCPVGVWECGGTPKPDDSPCDDSDPCTEGDTCQSGECMSGNPVLCPPPLNECFTVGPCDIATGTCPQAFRDGEPCGDGGICFDGACCTPACQPGSCSADQSDGCGSILDCSGNCTGGTSCCSGDCVDLQTNDGNCGECGQSCSPFGREHCSDGNCVCVEGATRCQGDCRPNCSTSPIYQSIFQDCFENGASTCSAGDCDCCAVLTGCAGLLDTGTSCGTVEWCSLTA